MPGRSTTNAIYILFKMQEKYLIRKKKVFFTSVNFKKARYLAPFLGGTRGSCELIDGLLGL